MAPFTRQTTTTYPKLRPKFELYSLLIVYCALHDLELYSILFIVFKRTSYKESSTPNKIMTSRGTEGVSQSVTHV